MNKKIGLIGWWDGKNEGDKYILQCMRKAFEGNFTLSLIHTPFKFNWIKRFRLNKLNFLIIGGGGLFTISPPKPFDEFDKWKDCLKIPFGFLGVGIQGIKPKHRSVIKQIVESSKFFILRDGGSYELVSRFSSKIEKAPDLTFLHPRIINRKKGCLAIGVNLRVWNFDEGRTYDNDAWCRAINALPQEKETIPLSLLEGQKDADAMKDIDGKRNRTFDINIYTKIRIMIGMRLHSLIFAAQNSIPIIGIAYAPKVRRFFQEVGLEEFCLDTNEYGRLGEVFEEAMNRRGEIETILGQYTHDANIAITNTAKEVKNEILNCS
jgi:polysaccharide pyruvyl transferase WcaK-like protein